ncbi:hypothetical protein SLS62_002952 [Diatrype stigma]|uniref:AB hydrolase-1 domain-containing protein n=1 Tax=Diatrype stigma TaxID=117547 RepID=A0AAN9UXR0_9PEZI
MAKISSLVAAAAIGLGALAEASAMGNVLRAVTNPVCSATNYTDPYHQLVQDAGYALKNASVNDVTLSYAEGPDNGPPIVMFHAQLLDWFSYSRVMPDLAKSFHVYAVDYPGHGQTVTPDDYPMNANQIGGDLATFIEQEIGQPVNVTGNSSGGLLALWLAANRPDLVQAAVLEDPPLFSSEAANINGTIANKAFNSSYKATFDKPDDFLIYWIDDNSQYFVNNIGLGTPTILKGAVRMTRKCKPDQPVEIGMLKNDDTDRMLLRGLDHQYDPRFGAAFYDGTWNEGFSHADALAKVACPTLLMQANFNYTADGILNGAMSQEDADKAMSLLQDGTYQRVNATHVVNLDAPDVWLTAVKGFFGQ